MSALTDKNAILQVIGCLIKAPVLLADSKYIITKKDFDVPLANMIFQVINNLFSNYRMNEISIVDIDNYLQQMEGAYDSFKKQNGIQYLNDCIELSNLNSFDFYYNRMKKFSALRALKKWTKVGEGQRILFFATEMEKEEIQTMILAHLSAVNEDKILNNKYENPEEKQRVRDAIKVLEKYQDNFIFVRVGDPSIAQIKTLIRQQVLEYDIQYVFYDYIFSSPGLLKEYRDLNLREDVILMMASIALKDLANELEIFVMSGTQLNEKWKEYKGIRDYNLIRGSKAIADKIDVGGISLPLTQEEHDNVDQIARKLNLDLPTQVQDMYKIRRGKYNRVRIWSRVDLGTCRTEDLFLTDQNFNYIPITTNKYIFEDEMGSIINQEKMEEERKELKENMEDKKEKVLSFDDLL